jgi:hypothetical protein
LIGLSLSNYVNSDFGNTTLVVMTGWLKVEVEGLPPRIMSSGDRMSIPPDRFHKLTPIKSEPASYMFIYVNTTHQMLATNHQSSYLSKMRESDLLKLNSITTKSTSNRNKANSEEAHKGKNAWVVRYGNS